MQVLVFLPEQKYFKYNLEKKIIYLFIFYYLFICLFGSFLFKVAKVTNIFLFKLKYQ